jgi:hypothetical protein
VPDAGVFDLCSCNPSKCMACQSDVNTCQNTSGCRSVMHCVLQTSSCGGFPNNCQSCQRSSAANQAAQSLATCMGGCP